MAMFQGLNQQIQAALAGQAGQAPAAGNMPMGGKVVPPAMPQMNYSTMINQPQQPQPSGVTQQKIQQIYQNQLGRGAQQAGMDYWMSDAAKGHSLDDIRRSIMASDEAMAFRQGSQNPQAQQYGLSGSEQALRQTADASMQALQGGLGAGTRAMEAREGYTPYVQQGQQALQMQSALAGAQGPEALQQALASMQPVNQFQQQQGEQAILRNAAALGGLGGGNVQKDLMQYGQGLASQNINDQFNRLGAISGQGLQGAGMQANTGQALLGANVGVGQTGAGITSALGQMMSQGRTRAGEQLAGIQQAQGAGVSDMLSGQNLANILMASGQGGEASNLASILANLATQQANMSTGQTSTAQFLNDQGLAGGIGTILQGVGTAYGAFNQ